MKRNLACLLLIISSLAAMAQKSHYLLVGTYTNTGSKGIYVYQFNPVTASVTITDSIESSNPSFLTVAPGGSYVFAVNEDADSTKPGGGVSAFTFNKKWGKLNPINKVSSAGNHPCYITIDKKGKWLIVGNYSSGNFSVLRVAADGQIENDIQTISHSGNSVDPVRQTSPHVHATVLSNDQKYLYVTDLGIDKIICYPFNVATGKVDEAHARTTNTSPGSGPRHLAFHPNNKYVYLMQELNATVTVYKNKNGQLIELQSMSSQPLTYKGPAGSADIHVSPDGKFLYCSNRALSNSIGIFKINAATGMLQIVGHQYTMGVKPRNFNFDPTGKFLLVANQETNEVVIFKRDVKTGLLTDTGKRIAVPKPVCLQWVTTNLGY
jgi:6-phosphogluconolactonase